MPRRIGGAGPGRKRIPITPFCSPIVARNLLLLARHARMGAGQCFSRIVSDVISAELTKRGATRAHLAPAGDGVAT